MRLTRFGHSCVLVEYGDCRILIDPGNLSSGFESLTGLNAIVITHGHPDHVDWARIPALIQGNPQAHLLVEHGTARSEQALRWPARPVDPGARYELPEEVTLEAVGGKHAVVHPDLPAVTNVGVVVRCPGELSFFHPGDCLDVIPADIDILGIPLQGPWSSLHSVVTFARAVAPGYLVPLHDGLLNTAGRQLYWGLLTSLADSGRHLSMLDLVPGQPSELRPVPTPSIG